MRRSPCSSSGRRLPWLRAGCAARRAKPPIAGILVPVRFEDARLPMDVRALHTTDLDNWGDDPGSPPFQEVLRALGSMIARHGATARPKSRASSGTGRVGGEARTCFDLRPAVRQHERRRGTGILQRRHQRGHHHGPQQGLFARRRLAQHRIRFQGQEGRYRPDREAAQGRLRAGRQRAQGGRPRPDNGPADRGIQGQPDLGRAIRPRPERHLRAPGRDLAGHRQGAQVEAPARGKEGHRAARDDQSRGLQSLPDGAAVQRHGQLRQRPSLRGDHPALPKRHGDRSGLRDRMGADGRCAGRAEVLFQRSRRRRPGGRGTGAVAGQEPGRRPRSQGARTDFRGALRRGIRGDRGSPAPRRGVVRGQFRRGPASCDAAAICRSNQVSTRRRRR